MKEYKMVKCPTCGQETKGPALVRFSPEQNIEWAGIILNESVSQRQFRFRYFINGLMTLATFFLSLWNLVDLLPIVSGLGTSVDQFLSVIVPTAFIYGVFEWSFVSPVSKRDKLVQTRKKELLELQGIKEGEPYEVVRKKFEDLSDFEKSRIEPLRTALIGLKPRSDDCFFVGMYGTVGLLVVFVVGSITEFIPKDLFSRYEKEPLQLMALGLISAVAVFSLSALTFWRFHIKPKRRKIIDSIRKMIMADSSLLPAVEEIYPDLVKRFSRLLKSFAG